MNDPQRENIIASQASDASSREKIAQLWGSPATLRRRAPLRRCAPPRRGAAHCHPAACSTASHQRSLAHMRLEEFHFSVFNYAKLILASHARQTPFACHVFMCIMTLFTAGNKEILCINTKQNHHSPPPFEKGRGFVTIGDKTSTKEANNHSF